MGRRDLIKLGAALTATASVPAWAQSEEFRFHSPLAEEWFRGGDHFEWTSTTEDNRGQRVNVFYRTFGNRDNPALVLVHGYPTSSYDFRQLVEELRDEYFIALLDFPGFGFSDKPQNGYSYMLEDDARLLDHFVDRILGLERFHLFTHDRGVSVGLAFLGHYLDAPSKPYRIDYHFLSNSGMFLPLATLSEQQTVLLDPRRGAERIAELKARPRRTEGTPDQVAYADIQAFNDGLGARLYVGRYLLERAENEARWLENLPRSPIPVGFLWGLRDPVNPVRIANHVWETYISPRDVESSFWYLPEAGHYPQRDAPGEVADVIRRCLDGGIPDREAEDAFMQRHTINSEPGSAVYVGRSEIRTLDFDSAIEYHPSGYRE